MYSYRRISHSFVCSMYSVLTFACSIIHLFVELKIIDVQIIYTKFRHSNPFPTFVRFKATVRDLSIV